MGCARGGHSALLAVQGINDTISKKSLDDDEVLHRLSSLVMRSSTTLTQTQPSRRREITEKLLTPADRGLIVQGAVAAIHAL